MLRTALVLGPLALLAAAAPAYRPRPAAVVTVTARDFAFDAPSSVSAGLTTFRLVNHGPSPHHVQLLRLEEGKTMADFLAALKAGGPPPRWALPAGGPNPPNPGGASAVTLDLAAGNYLIVCFIPAADGTPHMMKGMMRPLTVTPAKGPAAAEPATDGTMKLQDYSFQLDHPLTAGRHTLRVENDGAEVHEVAFVRLAPGKAPEDFAKWGEHQEGPPPGTLYGGVSGILPKTHAFVEVNLPRGDYGLICFMPANKDGQPHFRHGMIQRITVR